MKNLFSLLILLSYGILAKAQVTSVDYQIKYDSSTCLYDCCLVVNAGSATTTIQRIAFNSAFSIVTPHGSNVSVAAFHNPTFRNGPPGIPSNWIIVNEISYPNIDPVIDLTLIYLSNPVTTSYDTLYTDDTVKLFSLSIDPPAPNDTHAIRIFNNVSDPQSTDPNMSGLDFMNGFTMGGAYQLYNSNIDTYYPSLNQLNAIIDTSSALIINITPQVANCQLPLSYKWYGPNNYYNTTEDVFIDPYTPVNRGRYTLIITDAKGFEFIDYYDIGNTVFNYPVPKKLELTESINSIGVTLPILGDENLNSKLVIEYKIFGTSEYKIAAPSTRVHPSMIVDGSAINKNEHAACIMFLHPFTKYNIRAKLIDSDYDTIIIDTIINTLYIKETSPSVDTFYVNPGNGGGNGSLSNPFLGIQTAVSSSITQGKTILVNDGIYQPFVISKSGYTSSPTTIKSLNPQGAVIEGNNMVNAIVLIGNISYPTSNIIIDGFVIQNGHKGIEALHTRKLTIRNNKIIDVDFGIINNGVTGIEQSQHIYNNELIGRTIWPQTNGNVPGERGIDLKGNRNSISNNSISYFGDGISTDGPPYELSKNLEIHHNDITRIVDDLIEVDGTISNTLIYRNRLMNGRAGVSLAPILGGPAYVFRNEIINTEYSAFKLNRSTTGIQIYQNTILNSGYAIRSPSGWQSVYFKNNAVISEGYCYEEFQNVAGGLYKYKNNAYKSARNGTSAQPWFKWNNTRYHTLNALKTSTTQDSNSITVDFYDFETVTIPVSFDQEVLVSDNDLYPSVSSQLLNVGEILNSINNPFVTDSLPDIGALEYGEPYPTYGADFSNVCSYNDLSQMTWNGSKSNAWFDDANWTPCGVPNSKSAVIITANTPFSPFLNTEIEIKSLNIEFGASFHNYGNIVLAP